MASLIKKKLLDNNDQYQDFKLLPVKEENISMGSQFRLVKYISFRSLLIFFYNKLGCACQAKKFKYTEDKIFY